MNRQAPLSLSSLCFLVGTSVVAMGCASSDPPASDASGMTGEDPAQAAYEAVADRSSSALSVPSSLPGVESWNVYVESQIAIVGVDASGRAVAALVDVAGHDKSLAGIVCATNPSTGHDCGEIAAAIATDLGGDTPDVGGAKPADLHILANPGLDQDKCFAGLAATAKNYQDGFHMGQAPTIDGIRCSQQFGDCMSYYSSQLNGQKVTGGLGTDGLYTACCGVASTKRPAASSVLVYGTVAIICQ
jgi:hypothetical protein